MDFAFARNMITAVFVLFHTGEKIVKQVRTTYLCQIYSINIKMFGILIIFLFFSLFTELNHFSIPELQVNCGDRVEQSCSDCPNENGLSGCDGDCMWKNSTVSGQQCIQKGKKQIITCSCSLLLFFSCIISFWHYMTTRKNSRLIEILHSS